MEPRRFTLEIPIRCTPASVIAWWTDLPEDYVATDPTEEPYRIVTMKLLPEGKALATYWRVPEGEDVRIDETMTIRRDGSWEIDLVHPAGYRIHDEFRPVDDHRGTLLRVSAEVTPLNASAEAGLAAMTDWMQSVWRKSAKICERDAPLGKR